VRTGGPALNPHMFSHYRSLPDCCRRTEAHKAGWGANVAVLVWLAVATALVSAERWVECRLAWGNGPRLLRAVSRCLSTRIPPLLPLAPAIISYQLMGGDGGWLEFIRNEKGAGSRSGS
jgi:hypothetical protein